MPPQGQRTFTDEDQIKFLLSCIRNSHNGQVDYGTVATETETVSKGAAIKRLARITAKYSMTNADSGNAFTLIVSFNAKSATPGEKGASRGSKDAAKAKPSPKKSVTNAGITKNRAALSKGKKTVGVTVETEDTDDEIYDAEA
ncbi:hypothetical protein BGW36DRAFT_357872 [Talaromyces proteolyticus]|uniref:Myb-like DNA-binding domain-containing protein n=1 Tax=Talaromyces proteolyticus TaxID=1131652 RepID=A0AAD4KSF4_9EURO|nr:uncharacterized protein BGW36DRAFT_357872 [Talaromyces proteolyticus]KAH8698333.1 hypothetical protein BGW36DRAFT_357872 [Talaromyces proteolyticus]